MNKKIFLGVLFGCMALASSVFASEIKLMDAVRFAEKQVPTAAKLQRVEPYEGVIGVTFRNFDTFRNYIVFVDKTTGRPTERVMSSTNFVGSTNVSKSKTEITKIVFARYGKMNKIKVNLEPEGSNKVRYRVSGYNDRFIINALYNPVTGVLCKEHLIFR